jgi:hypothetical protein
LATLAIEEKDIEGVPEKFAAATMAVSADAPIRTISRSRAPSCHQVRPPRDQRLRRGQQSQAERGQRQRSVDRPVKRWPQAPAGDIELQACNDCP